MGQGITGWVAEHRKPVVIGRNAYQDPRFLSFTELPEDRYEAFLSVPVLCREKVVGVINVQHREPTPTASAKRSSSPQSDFWWATEIERAHFEAERVRFADSVGSAQAGGTGGAGVAARLELRETEARGTFRDRAGSAGNR